LHALVGDEWFLHGFRAINLFLGEPVDLLQTRDKRDGVLRWEGGGRIKRCGIDRIAVPSRKHGLLGVSLLLRAKNIITTMMGQNIEHR